MGLRWTRWSRWFRKVALSNLLAAALGALVAFGLQQVRQMDGQTSTTAQTQAGAPLPATALEAWQQPVPGDLQQRHIDEGLVHFGNKARVRRLKLMNGDAISVGNVGGSVAVGIGTEDPARLGYAARLFAWITESFPNAEHRFTNGGVDAVTSSYMSVCLNQHVPPDVDVVMIEFAFNDYNDAFRTLGDWNNFARRSFERLLRRLLMYPNHPAVILVPAFDHKASGKILKYYFTAEDEQVVLATYYSIPVVSFRAATWHPVWTRKEANFTVDDLMRDWHPNTRGHQIMGSLVAALLQRVGAELQTRPYSPEDEAMVNEELPEPMLENNVIFSRDYCLMKDKFRELVTKTEGFDWVDEAKPGRSPKPGFVANKPGSLLEFVIDTEATTPGNHVTLRISYLASYERHGQARVQCVAGCSCADSQFNSLWERHSSQLDGHQFQVTRHAQCTIRVTVMEQTGSEGHKIKLVGLAISDASDSESAFWHGDRVDWTYGEVVDRRL